MNVDKTLEYLKNGVFYHILLGLFTLYYSYRLLNEGREIYILLPLTIISMAITWEIIVICKTLFTSKTTLDDSNSEKK